MAECEHTLWPEGMSGTVSITRHQLECDVLVAGGGPAGFACALSAARSGAKVILCQDRSVLGGNASSEVRMHIVGADVSGHRAQELAVEAREGGIIEEIRLDCTVHNQQRSASMLDLILYDKCRVEPNLTLMLNTAVVGATLSGDGRIGSAKAECQSTEDVYDIHARVFVDCTGDGRLGAEAGALCRRGRESKQEYGEPLAQDQPDAYSLGSTILFTAKKYGRPMPFTAPAWARKFTEGDLKFRSHAVEGVDSGLGYGYWWCEWGGTLDTIKDNEAIRDELLSIVMGIWDHVKNEPGHGADEWALDWVGFLPGKRESRRFVGQHILTEQDVQESRYFDDAIAYGGWPIDTHPPQGVDAVDERPCTQHHLPYLYDIPLRACVSKNVPNLMFAGRNISATHIAFATTRVMATCAAVGQGVGVAAAYAATQKVLPSQLSESQPAIREIQQKLLRDDAFLVGRLNEDSEDLAKNAKIVASSEMPEGRAGNVLTGQTRSVHGEGGVPAGRTEKGTHRWMSDPSKGLPAWLEVQWDAPITPREVRIIFDTGLHRVLTLSHCDQYTSKMDWGRPQRETVRSYMLLGKSDNGDWQELASVDDNHQRLRIHKLPANIHVDILRIHVKQTNGIDHARICEVRVYE